MLLDWQEAEGMARGQVAWWRANGYTTGDAMVSLGVYGDRDDLSWTTLHFWAAYMLLRGASFDGLNLEQYRSTEDGNA